MISENIHSIENKDKSSATIPTTRKIHRKTLYGFSHNPKSSNQLLNFNICFVRTKNIHTLTITLTLGMWAKRLWVVREKTSF